MGDPNVRHLLLIPEYWKWPDSLHAALAITGALPYDGAMVFHKLGFGRVAPFLCNALPRVTGVRIEELVSYEDYIHQPEKGDLGWFSTIHIILPDGYEIDWDAYHKEA